MLKFSAAIVFVIGSVIVNVISFSLVPSEGNKWENGVIPIEIKGPFTPQEKENIENTINLFNEKTCVKFIHHTNEQDFVTIQNTPTSCWTSVGRVGGEQFINLESPKCTENIAIFHHKLMHVLGFDHDEDVEEDHFHQAEPLDEQDIENISELYGCNKSTAE